MRKADIWFVVGVLLVLLGILMFIGVVKAAPIYSDVSSNLTYVPMGDSIELRAKWTPGLAYYDISTATYVDCLNVSGQDTFPTGMAFNNDGTKLYVAGGINDYVYEYNLSTPYDVSTATYVDYFYVGDQVSVPTGMAFNNDGTKLYVIGSLNDRVYEYSLSTPYDVSTATYVDYFYVGDQESTPTGIAFNNNGTKLYVVGTDGDQVCEYDLSTPYDISTATYVDCLNVSGQDTDPRGIAFNDNGSRLYVVGGEGDKILEYILKESLDTAILYVNLTGSFQAVDTIDLGGVKEATWSNFSYTPDECNKAIKWKIWANTSKGTSNETPIQTFYVMPYLYSTSDSSIISSIDSCSSKHNATITPTGSGDVNLTFYMPYFVRNATFKECNYEVTEDADRVKISTDTEYCIVSVINLEAENGTSFYVKESTGLRAFPPSNLPAAIASAGLVIIVIYTIVTRKRS